MVGTFDFEKLFAKGLPAPAAKWEGFPKYNFVGGHNDPEGIPIEGLIAAAKDDVHVCALPPLAGPHPPNSITAGSTTVFIGGRPAARMGDPTGCGAPIVSGALSVFIGG